MSKTHDENQDVRILMRKVYVNVGQKTIRAPKGAIIGNKSWGRIDYLCHYCGYHFIWDNSATITKDNYEDADKKSTLHNAKRAAKEHNLTDKTKRTSNCK